MRALLQVLYVPVEEMYVFLLEAEPPPQHGIAQQASLVTKPSEDAIIPRKSSAAAAGYDLSSAVDVVVPPQNKDIVSTDLAVAVPINTVDAVGHHNR